MSRKLWNFSFNKLAAFLAIVMIIGCSKKNTGPNRATIGGRISYNGQPLDKGVIEFVPTGETKGPSSGGAIENGKYNITEKGPTPGLHKVLIRATRKTVKMVDAGLQTGGTKVEATEQYIPPQYNSRTTLEVNIKSGSNKQDFDSKNDDPKTK